MEQKTFDDADELVAYMQLLQPSPLLTAVDGWDGSGKTCLAQKMALHLGAKLVDLDCYLIKNCGKFIDCIKFYELASDIENSNQTAQLIISGVCVLHALERLKLTPNLHVYVKRISQSGLWCDECKSTDENGNDPNPENSADQAESNDEPLQSEIREYHLRISPHEKANVIFNRRELTYHNVN